MSQSALLVSVLLAGCVASAPMNRIDALFSDYTGAVPGASVIALRDGHVVLRASFGLADLEEGRMATADTHYRLASLTKQFTAAAVLTLASEERLSLDDSLRHWLPSLPPHAGLITVRHLLTHSSGLADYEDLLSPAATVPLRDCDVLRLLEGQAVTAFDPGSAYHYSNSGYALLSLIVERASGQRFAGVLRDRLFGPLGMTTTVAHEEGVTEVTHRAYGYSRRAGQWERTDQSMTSAVLGDGGVYTSVDQFVLWLRVLDEGRFSEASIPRIDTDAEGVRYGFGWRISEHEGRRLISHTGETIGFRNAVVRFPDENLSVVVLTNRNEGHPLEIAVRIAALLRTP